jgi:hypothetical protein
MGRIIAGIVIGYLVMFVLVFASFTAAYAALGADGAFKPGSYDVSTTWIVISFALGLIAAIAGGYVCALIAQRTKAARGLAGVVLVLGLLMAIPAFMATPSNKPRTADVPNMEAMMGAQTPAWIALLNPFVAVVGILAGASLRKQA